MRDLLTQILFMKIAECNQKVQDCGYTCCREWLETAKKKGDISKREYVDFCAVISLRNNIAHCYEDKLEVTEKELVVADKLLDTVNRRAIKLK